MPSVAFGVSGREGFCTQELGQERASDTLERASEGQERQRNGAICAQEQRDNVDSVFVRGGSARTERFRSSGEDYRGC